MTKFISIDGEGHGDKLVLLAANSSDNSAQQWIEDYEQGLSTEECVEFLWMLRDLYPGARFVGFSFTYDVNMILFPVLNRRKPMVKRLHEKKYVRVNLPGTDIKLAVRFYPGKFVIFTEYSQKGIASGRSIRIEDTFGFYQQSFVKALDKWEMSDQVALDRIAEGKKHRADEFAELDKHQVREYCLTECQQLSVLTEKLEKAVKSAGITLKKFIGAGAIAQTYMQKYNVHNHVVHDNVYGKDIQNAIMHAYFGGRSEIYQQGYFRNPTYVYDINSAYPAQTLTLPSLRNGLWREYNGTPRALQDALDEIPYGLCYVSWDLHEDMPRLVPFPKRMPNGNIRYRSKGTGWYWITEVRAALRHFPENITIHKILEFEAGNQSKPFDFVKHLADMRLQAKRNGLASAQIYKLGLNSLYGKTAQAKRGGRYPAYQSYVWAGMITAGTRAQLLDVIAPNRDSVIACATDGVIFAENPDIQQGTGLGEWEAKHYDELLYLQAGVYFCNGYGVNKTRGHILADLRYEEILGGWLSEGPNFEYKYTSRRFVGMGLACHLNDFSIWCDWIDFPRTLRCKPPGKIPETSFTYDYEGNGTNLFTFKHDKENYNLRCMPTLKNEDSHSAMFRKFDIKTTPTKILDDYFIAKEQPEMPANVG